MKLFVAIVMGLFFAGVTSHFTGGWAFMAWGVIVSWVELAFVGGAAFGYRIAK